MVNLKSDLPMVKISEAPKQNMQVMSRHAIQLQILNGTGLIVFFLGTPNSNGLFYVIN